MRAKIIVLSLLATYLFIRYFSDPILLSTHTRENESLILENFGFIGSMCTYNRWLRKGKESIENKFKMWRKESLMIGVEKVFQQMICLTHQTHIENFFAFKVIEIVQNLLFGHKITIYLSLVGSTNYFQN